MKYLKKVFVIIVVAGAMVMMIFGQTNDALASEFEGKETEWTNKCSQINLSNSDRQTCYRYQDYLKNLQSQKLSESADTQKKIDGMQGDLTKLSNMALDYQQQVGSIESEIGSIEAALTTMEGNIVVVEDAIAEQQVSVDARKNSIKSRMVDIQSSINTSEYVNFIMGSENLVDFIQRAESIGTITEHDNKQLTLLNKEIEKLTGDKEELVRIQDTLKVQKSVLDTKKSDLLVAQSESKKVLGALTAQQENLKAQKASTDTSASEIGGLMPSIPAPIIDGGNTGGGTGGGGSTGGASGVANFYGGLYDSPGNIFSVYGYTGQCTWYCFGRAIEVNGNGVRGSIPLGNANSWYGAYGGSKGQSPRGNAIVVWGGAFGHVAFVESYSNGMITISEGNVNAPGTGLPMWTSLETAIQYTRVSTISYSALVSQRGAPIGFIYF